MGVLKGTFSESWGWRTSSGLTSTQSKYLNLRREDSLSYSVGDTISSYSYKNIDLNNYTFAFEVQFYTTGSTQYLLDWYGNSENYISAYLSSGTVYLKHEAGDTLRTASCVPTLVEGNIYHLVFRGSSSKTIDGTNFLKITVGASAADTTGGTTSALGTLAAADTTYSIGQTWRNRGESCLDGRLWLHVLDYAWTDTEVLDFINSGVVTDPVATTQTRFMMDGTLSGGLPQGIYFDSSEATTFHSETFEIWAGTSGWTGENATLSGETATPLFDAKSLAVTGVTGGGYGYRNYSVSSSTPYLVSVYASGQTGQTIGMVVAGDVSGTLSTGITVVGSGIDKFTAFFVTGASDSSIQIRLFDNLDDSSYLWNGSYMSITNWESIDINWEDLT